MHLTYREILMDKPYTVRGMPWLAMADAAAVYQGAAQSNVYDLGFGRDWFDDDGQWQDCHAWAGERSWERGEAA